MQGWAGVEGFGFPGGGGSLKRERGVWWGGFAPPLAGGAAVAAAEDAGEISGTSEAGFHGDGLDLEIGAGEKKHGAFELDIAKDGAWVFVADGQEEAAEVAWGEVDGGGYFVDSGLLAEVLFEPKDGGFYFFLHLPVGGGSGGG